MTEHVLSGHLAVVRGNPTDEELAVVVAVLHAAAARHATPDGADPRTPRRAPGHRPLGYHGHGPNAQGPHARAFHAFGGPASGRRVPGHRPPWYRTVGDHAGAHASYRGHAAAPAPRPLRCADLGQKAAVRGVSPTS